MREDSVPQRAIVVVVEGNQLEVAIWKALKEAHRRLYMLFVCGGAVANINCSAMVTESEEQLCRIMIRLSAQDCAYKYPTRCAENCDYLVLDRRVASE